MHMSQFGSHSKSACIDAGLTLLHDINRCHAIGLKCGMVLLDVQGFFNNINHARLAAVLRNCGFHSSLVDWVEDFLRDRKVRLKFNSYIAEERDQLVRVPQGSPLSPILSALYTSPLLELSSS